MPNVVHKSKNLWTGELQYIRKTNLPDRIDLPTLVDGPLGLQPSEGLLERCHFAYRIDLSALALQSSRYIKPTTFAGYVTDVVREALTLTLVVRKGAYQRLMGMRTIASMTVRIEKPADAGEFGGLKDPGVAAMAELLTNVGAAKIEITLKREKPGAMSLLIDKVKSLVDSVRGQPEIYDFVESLEVRGKREDDEKLEPVDLIDDRLSFEGDVEYDDKRRLDPVGCQNLLVNALDYHELTLRSTDS